MKVSSKADHEGIQRIDVEEKPPNSNKNSLTVESVISNGEKGKSGVLEDLDNRLSISTKNDRSSVPYDDEMLKLVRGTLESAGLKQQRDGSNEDTMSQLEFQQWTAGILNDDYVNEGSVTKEDPATTINLKDHHSSIAHGIDSFSDLAVLDTHSHHTKSSKSDLKSKTSTGNNDFDRKVVHHDSTMLGPLDATTFIHDALLNVKTLESLTSLDSYTKKSDNENIANVDKAISQLTDIDDSSAEKEVQHLAVQAVQQAVAEAEAERQQSKDIPLKVEDKNTSFHKENVPNREEKALEPRGIKRSRSLKALDENQRSPKRSLLKSLARLYDDKESSLIIEAIIKAKEQVPRGVQGQYFSVSEVAALDVFIHEYCRIFGITIDQMKQRIWSNGKKKDCFWRCLQEVLPERSRASLYKHVRRSYHIFKVRGKWTKQEDEQLAKLGKQFNGRWQLVGKKMGRMPEDCRDRWRNYIKCGENRKTDKWTPMEEEKLMQVISGMLKSHDSDKAPRINFTKVSELMDGTRSRIQCRYKWKKLQKRYEEGNTTVNVKRWLLSRLKEIWSEEKTEHIDWDALAAVFSRPAWKGKDLHSCFEGMKNSIQCQGKTFPEIIDRLLEKYRSA